MGSTTILLSIAAVMLMVSYTEAVGDCPIPSKVYGCSPTCVKDYECANDKVCCFNKCNLMSCSKPAGYGAGYYSFKENASGSGVYCGNVMCNSFEKCKLDPSTKRMKCSRPWKMFHYY